MALNSPFAIRIQKPKSAFAETMNPMRLWLDKHKVEHVRFKVAEPGVPEVAFDIQFRNEDEAVLFAPEFAS